MVLKPQHTQMAGFTSHLRFDHPGRCLMLPLDLQADDLCIWRQHVEHLSGDRIYPETDSTVSFTINLAGFHLFVRYHIFLS